MSGLCKISVLHVDDESALAELAADMLKREDSRFSVETATSVKDGLDCLTAGDFDCIISDYQMPGQNGIEFLETVRRQYPNLPFVLYTAKGSEEVASDALSAGATDYFQKGGGSEHYELLANRIINAVEKYRASQRAAELDRIRSIHRELNQALVRSESRNDAEARICEIISDSDPYLFTWIGDVDPDTDQIKPRKWAGIEEGYLEAITVTADDTATGHGPGGTAIRERRVAVSQNINEDPKFEPWRSEANKRGYQAVAAVPLEYDDTLYGELLLYSERPYAFDRAEKRLLENIGTDIGSAFHSFETQQTLREERVFTKQALNAINDIFYVITPENNLSRVNDRACEVTGYSKSKLLSMNPTDFIPPADIKRVEAGIREALETGSSRLEANLLTRDGESIPYEFRKRRLTDPAGNIIGVVGVGRDISARKEQEQELKLFERLINHSDDEVYVTDAGTGVIQRVNQTTCDHLGYTEEEIVGMEVPEISTEFSTVDEYINSMVKIEHGEGYQVETSHIRADGTTYPVEVSSSYVETSGGEFVVAIARDITNRKEREAKLRRQNERLNEFASVVAHDLRNPLNVAQARVRFAQEESDTEHHDIVVTALNRMERIIDDVLWLAREGRDIGSVGPVALDEAIESTWKIVSDQIDNAELRYESDRGQLPTIKADYNRLCQLLENLFKNAVEHGGDDVTITVGALPDGFYVEDDGTGIPEKARDDVFDMGYSTAEGGTGFGLKTVKQIVEAHGWGIVLAEANSGGARFEITAVEFTAE